MNKEIIKILKQKDKYDIYIISIKLSNDKNNIDKKKKYVLY